MRSLYTVSTMAIKRLYRSEKNKILGGVLGGLGEYVDVDPVLFRLFYVAITIFTGVLPGILVYILALFIVPLGPRVTVAYEAPAASSQTHAEPEPAPKA
jgi:phage shock protein C